MKKILVVDNDRIVLEFMNKLLGNEGYQVVSEIDGLKAFDTLKTYTPDFIFVDLVMPNIDGEMLCKIIRSMPRLKDTCLVILSAVAAENWLDASQLEADVCIAKGPFNEMAKHVLYVLDEPEVASSRCRSGEVLGLKSIYPRGITKELLSVKKHFDIILDRMSEGILEINSEGRIVFANPFALSLFDIHRDKLLGSRFVDLFSGEDHQRICDLMTREHTMPKTITEDSPVLLGGSQVTLNIFPVDKDEFRSIVVLYDITERKQVEETLRESKERYRTLIETIPDPLVVYDPEGRATYINDAFEQIYGWSRKELLGDRIDFVPPEETEATQEAWRRTLQDGTVFFETKRLNKNGDLLDIQLRTAILCDQEGKHALSIVIHRDITERVRAEKALKEQAKTLKDILEQAADGICVCHNIPEEPYVRFTHWNPRMTEITGYTIEEINRLGWYQTMYPDPELQQKAIERMARMRQGVDIFSETWGVTTKDGSKKPLSMSTSVLKEDNGKIHVLATMQDISERQKVLEELREIRERYDLATKGGNVGIWDWNLNTGEMFVSPNLKALLGYDDGEIRNHVEDWGKHVYAEDVGVVMKEADACIEGTKKDYHVEHRMVHKDGSVRWFLASGKVKRDVHGQAVRFVGTDTDITNRKKLEEHLQQSRKMEAIGTLAGGIAHEFNNILGIIIGNTELAIDDVPEWNPAKDCLEEIRSASLRAKDVVRQIMSFARKTPATRKPIGISTIVKETLKLIRATIPTSIEIRQEILCDYEMILANLTEISQILLNLCSNSAHAMEEETGILEVKLETVILDDRSAAQYEDLDTGEYVKMTVKDTGKGIDPKIMGRIFDPYFTTKDVGKGLGMGLAVVYGLVKKHDGAIRLMSEVGKGTTVEVLFPVTEEIAEIVEEKSNDLPIGAECILFVDDEPSLIKLVKQMLERQGYEVVGKTSSPEALKLFQEEPDRFDLIITDMAMSDMPGDRLAQKIIKLRPNIPIIICTGHSDRIDEEKANEMGIAAYTTKPLVKTDLLKTVRKVLDETKGSVQG